MEKITTQQNDRLLDLLDGKLSGAEAAVLKKQLEQSPALRQRMEELRLVHTFLSDRSTITVPDSLASFTERVMNNLDRMPSAASIGSLSPRNGLLLLLGILVATGIGMVLLTTGAFDSLNGPIHLDALNVPKGLINITVESIPFSAKTLMKALIIINLCIAFIVLDRTVLKPFFDKKHRSQSFS